MSPISRSFLENNITYYAPNSTTNSGPTSQTPPHDSPHVDAPSPPLSLDPLSLDPSLKTTPPFWVTLTICHIPPFQPMITRKFYEKIFLKLSDLTYHLQGFQGLLFSQRS
ncbi:unnamed protein product [Lactuca virosa]|uniref:Uncharacterized protein n=1 Tax=Lactuca virosa TaxID=75947 RepID=A0AAU9P4X0_9ASTR|nr:unnamed protein product [Lactuca virosa]